MKRGRGDPNSRQPFRNAAKCPTCGAGCRTIKTRPVSENVKEIMYQCQNEDCRMVWVAQLYPVRILTPSALPSPQTPQPSTSALALRASARS